jgi:hypothetical protein
MGWGWGLSLIALTIGIHTAGVVGIAVLVSAIKRRWLDARTLTSKHMVLIVVGVIGAVGLPLAALHVAEALIWAVAYFWVGALASLEEAMLYSVNSITTLGDSGLRLQPEWRIMGALEAADGMLLFGITTAFTFAIMQVCWSILSQPTEA